MSATSGSENEMLELLLSREGRATRVITLDGEPMTVLKVRQEPPSDPGWEFRYYADRDGIPVSADARYYFYTNEISRVEDVETGEVIFDRKEETGYTAEELERGEDRAWHIPIWGCLVFVTLATLVAYGLYRVAIAQGNAWSISW